MRWWVREPIKIVCSSKEMANLKLPWSPKGGYKNVISDDGLTWERISQILIASRQSVETHEGSWVSFGLFGLLAGDLCHSTLASFPRRFLLLIRIDKFILLIASQCFGFWDRVLDNVFYK